MTTEGPGGGIGTAREVLEGSGGECVTSTVVLDATRTVVGSAGMVFEAMGGSQGWPGCRRGYRRDCPG